LGVEAAPGILYSELDGICFPSQPDLEPPSICNCNTDAAAPLCGRAAQTSAVEAPCDRSGAQGVGMGRPQGSAPINSAISFI